MNSPLAHHATLEAILNFPADPLSAKEAGEVLGGFSASSLRHAAGAKRIEHTFANFRGKGAGSGKSDRLRFSKAALIKWLWDHTSGDKAVLSAALDALCPELWPLLKGRGDSETRRPGETESLPKNVIRMRRTKTHEAAFAGPDFFESAQHAG